MCDRPGCQCEIFSMDSKTPINLHLTAYFKRSFAFYTIKERHPVIITKLIDHLVRDKEEIYKYFGENTKEELKFVIGELSRLKYELQTNKPLTKFNSEIPDTKVYDWYLDERNKSDGEPKFFTTIWLFAECYMYRKIKFAFENTQGLVKYDPFRWQKKDSFYSSLNAIDTLMHDFIPFLKATGVDVRDRFLDLLKINLWGNKCDLSISSGAANAQEMNPMDMVALFEPNILCNHSQYIWNYLTDEDNLSEVVELVNDNAGYEMITDFCLADFLITHHLAKKIYFNIKAIPWFVSDTTIADQRWLIRSLINSDKPHLKKFGIRWNKYIREKTWIIDDDPFWTYPFDFTYMESKAPNLYNRFKDAKFAIFKGDLNYRKLFGEKNWEPTTPINVAMQNFHPTTWCTLRTLKADMICGLEKGTADNLEIVEPNWQVSGKYGVIQYSEIDSES